MREYLSSQLKGLLRLVQDRHYPDRPCDLVCQGLAAKLRLETAFADLSKIDHAKIDALAAFHRQRRYAAHLIAIRDAAVILAMTSPAPSGADTRQPCRTGRRASPNFFARHPAASPYRGSGPQPHASTSRARITVTPTPAWLRDPHLAADLLNRRAAVSLSQGKRNQPLRAVLPNALGSES